MMPFLILQQLPSRQYIVLSLPSLFYILIEACAIAVAIAK